MTELRPHDVWVKGRRFRVIAPGAKLSGLVSIGPSAWRGWDQSLTVGDVIECLGFVMGWGSDNIPQAMFRTEESMEAKASYVHFYPEKGMWSPYPREGFLEPVEE